MSNKVKVGVVGWNHPKHPHRIILLPLPPSVELVVHLHFYVSIQRFMHIASSFTVVIVWIARMTFRQVIPVVQESVKENNVLRPELVGSSRDEFETGRETINTHPPTRPHVSIMPNEEMIQRNISKSVSPSNSRSLRQSLRQSFDHISDQLLVYVSAKMNTIAPTGLVDEELEAFAAMELPSTSIIPHSNIDAEAVPVLTPSAILPADHTVPAALEYVESTPPQEPLDVSPIISTMKYDTIVEEFVPVDAGDHSMVESL